jgi:hypothetical protein
MTKNIAQEVRDSREFTWDDVSPLAAEAERLRVSLEVANKWVETADAKDADTLGARATYMRDTIEQEYSRVCFEMELYERRRVFGRMAERDEKQPLLVSPRSRLGVSLRCVQTWSRTRSQTLSFS